MRRCVLESCGKPLLRREGEQERDFLRRIHCNKRCETAGHIGKIKPDGAPLGLPPNGNCRRKAVGEAILRIVEKWRSSDDQTTVKQ